MSVFPSQPPADPLVNADGSVSSTWMLHHANQFEVLKALYAQIDDASSGSSGASLSAAEAAQQAAAAQVQAGDASSQAVQANRQAALALEQIKALQAVNWSIGDYRLHTQRDLGETWMVCDGTEYPIADYYELSQLLDGRTGAAGQGPNYFKAPMIEPTTQPGQAVPFLYWHVKCR